MTKFNYQNYDDHQTDFNQSDLFEEENTAIYLRSRAQISHGSPPDAAQFVTLPPNDVAETNRREAVRAA